MESPKIMMLIICVAGALLCCLGALNDYFHKYRSMRVFDLRMSLLEDADPKSYEIFKKLPSYNKMVYSFKPIRIESWYKEKE